MDLELLLAQWSATVPPHLVQNVGLARCCHKRCKNPVAIKRDGTPAKACQRCLDRRAASCRRRLPAKPHRRPASDSKFAGRPGRDYTVVGKGGLVRVVRLPDHLAQRLEARRLDEPVRVTDRGIHYLSRYDVAGGTPWSVSFSGASKRALGWTTGAHGARHAYAQERMAELQRMLFCADALETVSQELGHFRPEITETYLR